MGGFRLGKISVWEDFGLGGFWFRRIFGLGGFWGTGVHGSFTPFEPMLFQKITTFRTFNCVSFELSYLCAPLCSAEVQRFLEVVPQIFSAKVGARDGDPSNHDCCEISKRPRSRSRAFFAGAGVAFFGSAPDKVKII